jgi:hypothetical protein
MSLLLSKFFKNNSKEEERSQIEWLKHYQSKLFNEISKFTNELVDNDKTHKIIHRKSEEIIRSRTSNSMTVSI